VPSYLTYISTLCLIYAYKCRNKVIRYNHGVGLFIEVFAICKSFISSPRLRAMITTKKSFGSYVLTKVDFYKLAAAGTVSTEESAQTCAVPSDWTELKLLEVRPYNHDTSLFRFQLPEGKAKLNLPVGGFLLVLAPGCEHDGTDAIRPYTSIQDDDVQPWHALPSTDCISNNVAGTFELLCKRYDQWGVKESIQTHFLFTKTNHSYRPPGAVSNYIHKLKIGDYVKFKRK